MSGQRRRARVGLLLFWLVVLGAALWPPGVGAQEAFPAAGQLTQLAEALNREGTYVAPRARQQVPVAAEEQLQNLITRAETRDVSLRIAVLDQLPSGYVDLEAFAEALAGEMRLRDAVLIVATPQALAARSDQLPRDVVAPLAAEGGQTLASQGLVAAIAATADAVVGRAAALVTPVPRPTAGAVPAPAPGRAPAGQPDAPLWPVVVGLAILLGGLGLYWWTTNRRWGEVLGALEGARAAAERLATTGDVPPATVETAQRRLAMGERALDALRAIPWWQTWLWPWAPPPQLALAERAFSESLRLLGGGGASVLAPLGPADAPAGAASPAPWPPPETEPPAPGRASETSRPAEPLPPVGPERDATAPLPGVGPERDATAPLSAADVTPRIDAGAPLGAGPLPPAASAVPPIDQAPPAVPTPAPAVPPPGVGLDAPQAPARRSGGGWFGRGQPKAPAEPAGSLEPERVLAGLTPQEPIACFFCARPLAADQAETGALALGGLPLQPVVCHRHAGALTAEERPGVRARLVEGQAVPWFQDPSFLPAWDFDPGDQGPMVSWDELPAPDRLFAPPPRVVVHAGDPRWAALRPTS